MGVEHGGGGAPEREPTPSEAKRPENNQPTLEVGEGRHGVPPPQGETAKPNQENAEGNPVISLTEYKLAKLRKERDRSGLPSIDKNESQNVSLTNQPPAVFDCSWIRHPSPEEVGRSLKEGLLTEEQALELKKEALRRDEEFEFRGHIASLVDHGLITSEEGSRRVRQFRETRDSEK
jgi:hypothetical protein